MKKMFTGNPLVTILMVIALLATAAFAGSAPATAANPNNCANAVTNVQVLEAQPSIIGNIASGPISISTRNAAATIQTASNQFSGIDQAGEAAGFSSGYSIIGRGSSSPNRFIPEGKQITIYTAPLAIGNAGYDSGYNIIGRNISSPLALTTPSLESSQAANNNPQQTLVIPDATLIYLINNANAPTTSNVPLAKAKANTTADFTGYAATQEVVGIGGTSKVANHGHVNSVNRNNTHTGMNH